MKIYGSESQERTKLGKEKKERERAFCTTDRSISLAKCSEQASKQSEVKANEAKQREALFSFFFGDDLKIIAAFPSEKDK